MVASDANGGNFCLLKPSVESFGVHAKDATQLTATEQGFPGAKHRYHPGELMCAWFHKIFVLAKIHCALCNTRFLTCVNLPNKHCI
jgi:hypothetical protein